MKNNNKGVPGSAWSMSWITLLCMLFVACGAPPEDGESESPGGVDTEPNNNGDGSAGSTNTTSSNVSTTGSDNGDSPYNQTFCNLDVAAYMLDQNSYTCLPTSVRNTGAGLTDSVECWLFEKSCADMNGELSCNQSDYEALVDCATGRSMPPCEDCKYPLPEFTVMSFCDTLATAYHDDVGGSAGRCGFECSDSAFCD